MCCEYIRFRVALVRLAFFTLLLLLLFFPTDVVADRRHSHVTSVNQSLLYIDFFRFGDAGGRVELNVSHISMVSPTANNYHKSLNLSQIGFFLIPVWNRNPVDKLSCALHSNFTQVLLTFDELQGGADHFNLVFPVNRSGPHSINYQNCLSGDELKVSMDVRLSMYHTPTHAGGRRSYLSRSKIGLSWIDSTFIVMYLSLAVIWVLVLSSNYIKRPSTVHRIHLVMLFVLHLKAWGLLCELLYQFYLSRTGCAQCCVSILLTFMAGFLAEAPIWALLLLIATGWSSLKPYLLIKEKVLVITVIVLHVIMNILKVLVDQGGPTEVACLVCPEPFLRGKYAEFVVSGFICVGAYQYFALMAAIHFSSKFLCQCATAHGKASASLFTFFKFRRFFLTVLAYYAYDFAVVFVMEAFSDNSQYVWPEALLKELGSFVFCVCIGYKFRPEVDRFKFFGIDEDVEASAYQVLVRKSILYTPIIAV